MARTSDVDRLDYAGRSHERQLLGRGTATMTILTNVRSGPVALIPPRCKLSRPDEALQIRNAADSQPGSSLAITEPSDDPG